MSEQTKIDTADDLRRALAEPIYNRTLRKEVGRGHLDYEVYLRTSDLLALQTPADKLVVPDELLFQARVHPEQYSNSFSEEEVARLHDALRSAL